MKSRMWLLILPLVLVGIVCDDFAPPGYEEVSVPTSGGFGAYDRCGQGEKIGSKCVVYHKCDPDTNTIVTDPSEINKNGFGLIDIRFGENLCDHPLDVCCKISGDPSASSNPNPLSPTSPSPPSPTPSPPSPTPSPTPPSGPSFCGIRNKQGVDFKITGNKDNEAEYGEFPWMVAILKKDYNPAVDPVLAECGGSLIAPSVVLTGAHCVHKKRADEIRVRAGEWDTQTDKERLPYQERDVADIIIHEQFNGSVLYNDVALLILSKPFKKAEHIGTICLPNQGEVVSSRECFATGWGKNAFGREGRYQVILKKIELPTIEHQQCEQLLKNTRLGRHFELHDSFMCAGGEEGKDTCTGDGGSPLVCPDPNSPGRYVQVGIVAWGIGCGTTIPGVYADVGKFRNWVDGHMTRLNLNSNPYII